MIERVHRYKEKEPLFERFGVEREIQSTLDRRVDLPSGGYLIFDYAEAFTVIDVNTGRFVGLALEELDAAARGHDRQEQPRGREGGRAPAAPARHRRDHRHRLHRHGEPEEPPGGRGGAPAGARARPHEDVRRRDLAARPRRDDAAERHRRPARGDDAQVPDVRRRRDHRVRRDVGDEGRARAAARSPPSARAACRPTGSPCTRGSSRSSPARPASASAPSTRRRSAASSSSTPRATCMPTTSPCSPRARSRTSSPTTPFAEGDRDRGEARRGRLSTIPPPAPARSTASRWSSPTRLLRSAAR